MRRFRLSRFGGSFPLSAGGLGLVWTGLVAVGVLFEIWGFEVEVEGGLVVGAEIGV
jgi:hypothetical protein